MEARYIHVYQTLKETSYTTRMYEKSLENVVVSHDFIDNSYGKETRKSKESR